MIYSDRKENNTPYRNLANNIVMNLCSVYYGTGRDIYVDRYFTTHGLVCNLLSQKLTLVGTIMSNRREIPSQFKSARGREVKSTKALYNHSNGILLILYIPKQNRNILMMSSSHSDVSITDCHSKPTVIMDYNEHKGGVFWVFCRFFGFLRTLSLMALVFFGVLRHLGRPVRGKSATSLVV